MIYAYEWNIVLFRWFVNDNLLQNVSGFAN